MSRDRFMFSFGSLEIVDVAYGSRFLAALGMTAANRGCSRFLAALGMTVANRGCSRFLASLGMTAANP
jgi:hypothetical protein